MRFLFGSKAAIAAIEINYLQLKMFTQYADALALMSGFAAHDCSIVKKMQKKPSGT